MALNQEIWRKYIAENLIRANDFLNYADDVSGEVINGKIVHLANSGSMPTIVKNRASFPATVTQRTDTEVLYLIDEFSSSPTHIQEIEKLELSYDKVGSVMKSHVNMLSQIIGDWMLYYWLGKSTSSSANTAVAWSSGTFVKTTGSAATTATGNSPGTSTLKMITLANIASARSVMDRANIPLEDRFLVLPACFHDQLLTELGAVGVTNMSLLAGVDLQKGVINNLFGFQVLVRSKVALFNMSTATAPVAVVPYADDGTITAESNSVHGFGAIAYQKDMVEKAIGEIKFFETKDDAVYQGDLYSALVRAGGRAKYSAGTGIVPIVQVD